MTSSYNGWPASPDPTAIGIDRAFSVAGTTPFGNGGWAGGVKAGDVSTVLGYVASRLHTEVEPFMTDPGTGQLGYGCWGWQYRANANNPNNLSNHSSGTAIDYNAPRHPNGKRGTFTGSQVATIRDILAACQGAVEWGGDYTGTPDEMHFDIKVSASTLAPIAASLAGGGIDGGDDDMPLTDDDVDRIAQRVWDRILQPDGANTAAWTLLVQARNNADSAMNAPTTRPDILATADGGVQSRDEALAQIRNDVSALLT